MKYATKASVGLGLGCGTYCLALYYSIRLSKATTLDWTGGRLRTGKTMVALLCKWHLINAGLMFVSKVIGKDLHDKNYL